MQHISSWRWLTLVLLITAVSLGLGGAPLYGGSSALIVGPNIKVIHDNNDQPCHTGFGPNFDCNNLPQNEPTIAVDPTNPNILVAGANDYRLELSRSFKYTVWMGYYRSTDGGKTWNNSFVPGYPGDISSEGRDSPAHGFQGMSDPVLAFDSQGNAFYLGLIIPANFGYGNSSKEGVIVARYADHGAKYMGTALVTLEPTTAFSDKPCMAIDNSGGPSDGNIYVGWTRSPAVILFSRSTDHGKTFSPPQVVLAPKTSLAGFPAEARGCTITTDAKGNVYLFWRDQNICDFVRSFKGCQELAGDQRESISMSVSNDAGRSFLAVFPIQKIRPFDQVFEDATVPPGFRHRSFPSAASDGQNVYIVWDEKLTDQGSQIVISCSADQGLRWSKPAVVAPATTGYQVMPTVTVADGLVKVAWYDSRNDPQFSPKNPLMRRLDVYYAEAPVGCPVHFPASESIRVTDRSFDPNLKMFGGGRVPFIGDYISIASGGGKTHVIWTDNRDVKPQPVTNPPCDPKKLETLTQGCRNQNIYTATITKGP